MLRLDGEVRGLLDLQKKAARTDGVDDPGPHEKHVAGPDGDAVDEGRHGLRVGLAALHGGGKFLFCDPAVKAEVEAGPGPGGQDQPGLRLAVGAAEAFPGELPGGVGLHGKADGAVQVLHQDADVFPAPQVLLRMGG